MPLDVLDVDNGFILGQLTLHASFLNCLKKSLSGFLHLMVDIEVSFLVIVDVYSKELEGDSYCDWLADDENRFLIVLF